MPIGAVSTASDTLPPDLVEKFKAALDRLNPSGDRIGLAVSGGPDSMAMLLLAHAAIPGQFEVATVDHGLRPEAKDECALVLAACRERGIPCEIISLTVEGGNLQATARKSRYAWLGKWVEDAGIPFLATAHHADDQAETLIMRLNRGSGLSGLAGIREEVFKDGECWDPMASHTVIRPLLAFRRAELRQIVDGAGVAYALDPSNQDDRYDRVRIRKMLKDADWLDVPAIARSARHLAEADADLRQLCGYFFDRLLSFSAVGDQVHCRLTPDAPRTIILKLVERALRNIGGDPRGGDVARLVARLERGEGGNLAGVLATVEDGDWVFRPEPPRRTG